LSGEIDEMVHNVSKVVKGIPESLCCLKDDAVTTHSGAGGDLFESLHVSIVGGCYHFSDGEPSPHRVSRLAIVSWGRCGESMLFDTLFECLNIGICFSVDERL
jgi:hypothetical protein